ncbi:hypothetical protein ACTPOK_35985 [Streptomyces inhibens]|uniref:hypothetical protein n=1 Tax=Streptomyces inhibens TaxID=2293571 RepID=UPI00402A76A4
MTTGPTPRTPPHHGGENGKPGRGPAADFGLAVGLLVLDVIVALITLLPVMNEAGYHFFDTAANSDFDSTSTELTLIILGAVAGLSAWPLLRGRFFLSGWLQILVAGALWGWTLYGAAQGGA